MKDDVFAYGYMDFDNKYVEYTVFVFGKRAYVFYTFLSVLGLQIFT
jgi:hypothetical protein